MSPKFRGGSDDWMDDQDTQNVVARNKKKGAPPPARSRDLDVKETNAVVAEVFPKQARVRFDANQVELLCNYRMAALIDKGAKKRDRSPVAVGDRVQVEGDVIVGLAKRRNQLVRPAPDKDESIVHVLVANIDALVIVASSQDPKFSPGLVDRFLIAAQVQGIEPILCMNKIDLLAPGEALPWQIYLDLGFTVIDTSAKRGDGVDRLKVAIEGKVAAFCGHSGVGKTSLLRSLLESQVGRVGEVSESTGKGRHTTTGAILLSTHDGVPWIDTPGIREFGVLGVDPKDLAQYFPEIKAASDGCSVTGCLHIDEVGCAVASLPRYASYRRIFDSLAAGEH